MAHTPFWVGSVSRRSLEDPEFRFVVLTFFTYVGGVSIPESYTLSIYYFVLYLIFK